MSYKILHCSEEFEIGPYTLKTILSLADSQFVSWIENTPSIDIDEFLFSRKT